MGLSEPVAKAVPAPPARSRRSSRRCEQPRPRKRSERSADHVSGHTRSGDQDARRLRGQLALVDVTGEQRKVNVGMLPEETFAPGDWVIIHMGFVVEKTDRAGAEQAMAGLELMGRGRNPDGDLT